MYNPTPNWRPVSSFVEPVSPPGPGPFDPPLACIQVSSAWLSWLAGALMQLVLPTTWDVGATPYTVDDMTAFGLDLVRAAANAGPCDQFCAGMDPAHQSTFKVVTDANGVVASIAVGAGSTLGAFPVSYGAQVVSIPGTGDFVIQVDPVSGAVTAASGFSPLAGQTLLASVHLVGNGGVFRSHGTATLATSPFSWPYSTPVPDGPLDSWPSTSPLTLPTPAIFDGSVLGNPTTPVGDTTGFWCKYPGPPPAAAFASLGIASTANVSHFADPLCVVSIAMDNSCLPSNPCIVVSQPISSLSVALTSGAETELAGISAVFPLGITSTTTSGDSRYANQAAIASASGLSFPTITLTAHLSSC